MVEMPDGIQFNMQWKQVKYNNGKHSVYFEIVPMFSGCDVVVFPNTSCWAKIQYIFSDQERNEIIFLLERIGWKRDLRVIETNVLPIIDSNAVVANGSIESTAGYKELAVKNLFDPQSPLSKSEVKQIYCTLEERFAENVSGVIAIPKEEILNNSVLEKVSIPALRRNKSVVLKII